MANEEQPGNPAGASDPAGVPHQPAALPIIGQPVTTQPSRPSGVVPAALYAAPPIRGAIKTVVRNSTDNVVAGKEFSILVTVVNPFEIPLKLKRVSTHVPTEFYDVHQQQRQIELMELEEERARLLSEARASGVTGLPDAAKKASRFRGLLRYLTGFSFFGMHFEFPRGPIVAHDLGNRDRVSRLGASLFGLSISVPVRSGSSTPDEVQAARDAARNEVARQLAEYDSALSEMRTGASVSQELQAGNSSTRLFTLCTTRNLSFSPAPYRLQIEIDYEIGGNSNVDTVEHQFHVKASLFSILTGAVFGSVGGWLAKPDGKVTFDSAGFAGLAITVVLAVMAVVLFARKKDVQPLIAIEDFWGGVAIGFMVAYVGPKFLTSSGALPAPVPSASAH